MSTSDRSLRFALVGPGRVGLAMASLLRSGGHRVVRAVGRSAGSLDRAERTLGCEVTTDLAGATDGAEAIMIAIPDDQIAHVAARLAQVSEVSDKVFFHTAGALGQAPLSPLARLGGRTAAVHVLQAIPDVAAGVARIPGSWFGVTCDDSLRAWCAELVSDLGGHVLWVDESRRGAYHAAAVIASNFMVALGGLVETVGGGIAPYLPLMAGTLRNIEEFGPLVALTGPAVRGDEGTIRDHLSVLRDDPPAMQAYIALTLVALDLAVKSDRISREKYASMVEVLKS
ncbi:MAG TPA: DUF2520 domain-containing protein [Actinomycetota bacterium]|nr:DUF2520 domain-containing protein [Actinomycetota bacterium]